MATNRQDTSRHGRIGLLLVRMLIPVMGLMTAGCAGQGFLYTRVITPYSHDFHNTPTGLKTCRVNEHVLKEPVSGAGISVSFTSRVAEEAARAAGITNLYYADIETISILKGVYARKTLILCGD